MPVHGVDAYVQFVGDVFACSSLADQLKDLPFASGEDIEVVVVFQLDCLSADGVGYDSFCRYVEQKRVVQT